MSFRRRLTIFFLTIVAFPMVVLAIWVVQLSRDARDGRADQRLSSTIEVARSVYGDALDAAPGKADRLADRPRVASALAAGNEDRLGEKAEDAAGARTIAAVSFLEPTGEEILTAGAEDGVAFGRSRSRLPGEGHVGTVRVAALDGSVYVDELAEMTGEDAAIVAEGDVIATTTPLGDGAIPGPTERDSIEIPAGEVRAAALALEGAPPGAKLVVLTPQGSGFVASEPLAVAVLALLFGAGLTFILLLLRRLQQRVAAMLSAARRIGEGDFSERIPVEGDDEMAALARELNKMSARLNAQVGELRRQRDELDQSVRRIGEAFASGLDRRALLEIVVQTAAGACEAEAARAVLLDGRDGSELIDDGDQSSGELGAVLEQAGTAALGERGDGAADHGDQYAIAHALLDRRDPEQVLCTVAVARRGEPFSREQHEVLRYLIGQTATSIENIDLHELLARQAGTDHLTGLANHRHFSEWIGREAARVSRFGGQLSIVLLDLDDFKLINDTWGHLQGDRVLEQVGAILRSESRGIDESARYGGEEFVLALPGTGKDGAIEVAERLRELIAGASVAAIEGGPEVSVTASIGVATLPDDGADVRSLIAAADAALYRAKRAGKDAVSPALAELAAGRSQGNGGERRS